MSLYNGPIRADKDREFYLGHSVKALAGRWQKGKDVYWYTREKDGQSSSIQDEIKAVKAKEEEAMLEALGLKPKSVKPLAPAALDKNEMAKLLKRGGDEEEEAAGVGSSGALGVPGVDAGDKVAGLGFAKARAALGMSATTPKGGQTGSLVQDMEAGGTLVGVGISSAPPAGAAAAGHASARVGQGALPGPPPLDTAAAMLALVRAGVKLSKEQLRGLSVADQRVVKKFKKEVKKAKKEAKKQKKDKKRTKSSSSEGSSDEGDEGGVPSENLAFKDRGMRRGHGDNVAAHGPYRTTHASRGDADRSYARQDAGQSPRRRHVSCDNERHISNEHDGHVRDKYEKRTQDEGSRGSRDEDNRRMQQSFLRDENRRAREGRGRDSEHVEESRRRSPSPDDHGGRRHADIRVAREVVRHRSRSRSRSASRRETAFRRKRHDSRSPPPPQNRDHLQKRSEEEEDRNDLRHNERVDREDRRQHSGQQSVRLRHDSP
ncbi:hypothetical protein CEUSTIGMA_g13299.t1 [Chlamydomonas eustigma]|uniref:Multiple myeloma tumor-associated protein 2-like N-terminal domain-containing protein n=1 Tax=Chlamydomonas eustigma TaxID=1157962 RepID=A0A250XS85_9CHLO|nr:hypothetical protein CEUSTIGMA_g13299.t1 [Chlamydomonas eustigma]|eukprot:GAX85883.1 hypothetical protein CEUSTIGMA_g13299.t1 [Chlamydomonas eustigma]